MYCRQCGAELEDGVLKCPRCHTRVGKGKRYCQKCGYPRKPTDTVCPKCGTVYENIPSQVPAHRIPSQSIPAKAPVPEKPQQPIQNAKPAEQPGQAEQQQSEQTEHPEQKIQKNPSVPSDPPKPSAQALPPIMRKVLNNAELLESLGNKHVRKMITQEDSITDPKEYLALFEKTDKERRTNQQLSQELDKREKRRKELVQFRRTGQISEEQQKELDELESNTDIEKLKRQLQEQSKKGKWAVNHSSDFQSARKPEKKKRRKFLNKKKEDKAPNETPSQAREERKEKSKGKWHDIFQMAGFVLSICAIAGMIIPANAAPILMAVYAGISLIFVLAGRRGQYDLLSHAAIGIDIFFAVAMAAPYILKHIEIS